MKWSVWLTAIVWSVLVYSPVRAQYTYTRQFGSNGTGVGQLYSASGITTDSSGNVYYADTNLNRVTRFDSSSNYTSASLISSSVINPFGLGVFGNQLYVSESNANRVSVFNDSTGSLTSRFGDSGSAGTTLNVPVGLAIDTTGHVYSADFANQRIAIYNSDGTYSGQIANGNGYHPTAVAVDKNGNVFFHTNSNTLLYEYNSSGSFVRQFDGTGTGNSQQFQSISGIAVDSKGDIFVADNSINRVLEFDSNYNFLQAIGTGITGGGSSQLTYAGFVALDSNNDLFVTDSNNRIVEFSLSAVPEPSSFILCGLLASGGLGGYYWRRTRQRKLVMPAVA